MYHYSLDIYFENFRENCDKKELKRGRKLSKLLQKRTKFHKYIYKKILAKVINFCKMYIVDDSRPHCPLF